jgi:hypothetical protein
MQAKDFVTIEAAAKYFGVAPKTIRNWISRGSFTNTYRVGPEPRGNIDNRQIWISKADLNGPLQRMPAKAA